MEVLVKNPFTTSAPTDSLEPSFWDPDCFYLSPDFSMTSLLNLTGSLSLSPFFILDAKVAILLSFLQKGSVLVMGTGPIASVAALAITGSGFCEKHPKLESYINEYLPHSPLQEEAQYDQIFVMGENKINPALWKKLKIGGFYILGSDQHLELTGFPFEAFGRLFPFGEATEFGWRFGKDFPGLMNFELAKLKKLS